MQSSLVGQMCFEKGQTKVTYRNACFLMCNTGEEKIFSKQGLVTTVAYKLGENQPTVYALEGSVAVGGTALRWLGNRLGLLKPHENTELLASSVFSTGDVYFVPAINGLYAPSWATDAKGSVTQNAELNESICWSHSSTLHLQNHLWFDKFHKKASYHSCGIGSNLFPNKRRFSGHRIEYRCKTAKAQCWWPSGGK